jgi:hypothetical protein
MEGQVMKAFTRYDKVTGLIVGRGQCSEEKFEEFEQDVNIGVIEGMYDDLFYKIVDGEVVEK